MDQYYFVYPESPQTVPARLRLAAFALAVIVGGVYAGLSDSRYHQVSAAGALYAAGGLLLIVIAGIAASGNRFGTAVEWGAWLVAAALCAAAVVVFFLARTAGLPGWHRTDWPAAQVVAIAAAVGYVGCFVAASRRIRLGHQGNSSGSS